MADEHLDTSGSTDQFRAYVESAPAEPAPSKVPLLLGIAGALVVIAVIALLLRR